MPFSFTTKNLSEVFTLKVLKTKYRAHLQVDNDLCIALIVIKPQSHSTFAPDIKRKVNILMQKKTRFNHYLYLCRLLTLAAQ